MRNAELVWVCNEQFNCAPWDMIHEDAVPAWVTLEEEREQEVWELDRLMRQRRAVRITG